jgi:DNA invertase Pin-like site-specific DNA recombinase
MAVEVNFKDLRAAVVDLNKSGLIKKQVVLVGVAKEKIYEDFMAAMDKIEDDPETKEFPKGAEIALAYFNKMVDEEKKEKTEMVEKAKPAKPAKEKKEKPVKEKVGKNKYGHREGSQAALIDDAFEKGGSYEKIAENLKLSVARIKSHYRHMVSDKGIKFVEKGDTIKIEK